MARYALVNDEGLVVNVIALIDPNDYTPAKGLALVLDKAGMAEPGGVWTGTAFEPPTPADPIEAKPTIEERLAALEADWATNGAIRKTITDDIDALKLGAQQKVKEDSSVDDRKL